MNIKNIITPPINILFLSIVAVIVFYFSINAAWIGDDMMYDYKITEEYVTNYKSIPSSDFVPERIGSVGDLIESQNNHYFLVNGRYIAHVLVQIFCCWLGPVAFSFCNAAVWILLICLIIKTSGVNTSDWKFWLMTIILVVFTYLFKMVPSTEIGYVWMSAANLLFLSFLFRRGMSGWWTVPLILFSLLVGNGNETFSSGISMALIYYLIKHGRSLSLQKWLMIAAYGAGAIFLIASPGSWHRIGDTETQHGMGLLIVLAVGLPTTLILLSVVTYLCLTGKEKIQILFKDNIFYWIAFGFCLIFCIATGAPSIRSLCGTNLMAIVLLLRILKGHRIGKFWLVIGSIFLITIWTVGYINQKGQKATLEELERKYVQSATGEVYIDLWPITPIMSNFELGIHLGVPDMDKYFYKLLILQLRERYGLGKELKVYPAYLEGKENSYLDNRIVEMHPGVYLVVVKEGTTPSVTISRGVDFGLFSIPYDNYSPSLDKPVKTGKYWKAYVVYDDMWLISNLKAEINNKTTSRKSFL